MTKKDNKKGFTIIEVVLVLAIAGLIFGDGVYRIASFAA
ncbi:type II secretion system GspH family protein [Candidatus Minimicrobia vallesae]|uniref:Type II secretion system GspH family protein n=1 Tax=Candidatus Minimicrobia vallesae TaxID=2841264 RepID=A0A8F1M9W5_9BACT|nr:type II secretion system protein [Candidatus Minimicrobia vallesae]QWQ31521.1 type II secretion system GspH family protein [Candidatus Minimicrobia vallesae]